MVGQTVGEVVESRDPRFAPGDKVLTPLGWQLYGVARAADLVKVDASRVPASCYLGVTRHAGYHRVVRPARDRAAEAGETVVVSAASGAVGSVVGQLAKLHGLPRGGHRRRPRQVRLRRGRARLRRLRRLQGGAPRATTCGRRARNGVDVYFENVGGEVLDTVLRLMNRYFARRRLRPDRRIQRDRAVRLQEPALGARQPHPHAGHDRVRLEGPLSARRAARSSTLVAQGRLKYRESVRRRARQRAARVHRPAQGRELRQAARAARRLTRVTRSPRTVPRRPCRRRCTS